ncbi:UNVERIFIED_CONTAM: hypothetical protein RMT77_005246 [Armadillidium vulgare]
MHLVSLNNLFKDMLSMKLFEMNNCQPILENGNFLDVNNCKNNDPATYNGTDINCIRKWKPKGCNLHYYSAEDSKKCFKSINPDKKFLYFVGDSRMRYLYNKAVWNFANITLPLKFGYDDNVYDNETKTNITYLWRNYMNETFVATTKEIKEYLPEEGVSVVVFGVTLHMMVLYENKSEEGLTTFQNYLSQARDNIDAIGKKAKVLWFVQAGRSKSLKIVERQLRKWFPEMFSRNRKIFIRKIRMKKYARIMNITRSQIKFLKRHSEQMALTSSYNKLAEKILKGTSAKMWYSAKDIAENSFDDFIDPTHFSDYDNYNFLQIIINMVCNKFMKFSYKHCCT